MDCFFCLALEESFLGVWLRSSSTAFAFVEAAHVVALAMVFGTIAIVDLRLLGIPSTQQSFSKLAGQLLKWTWGAFAIAVVTGALMFVATPEVYFANTFFRLKLLALAVAGINMLIFEFLSVRTVSEWDSNKPTPLSGRLAGGISLLSWTLVIFFGRWIGYTKSIDVDPANFDFNIGSQFF